MSNFPIINKYYNNTSFSEEENTSLQSSFLGFGQTLSIATSLFKKRFSNLLLPVLIWQLALFVGFIFTTAFGVLFIALTVASNSTGLLLLGALIAIFLLLLVVCYLFLTSWIDFKQYYMLNEVQSKLFDNNRLIGKFFTIVGFSVILGIIYTIISTIFRAIFGIDDQFITFDSKTNLTQFSNTGFVVSLLVSTLTFYITKLINYVFNNYLYEQNEIGESISQTLRMLKNYFWKDLWRNLLLEVVQYCLFVPFAIAGFLFFIKRDFNPNNIQITNYLPTENAASSVAVLCLIVIAIIILVILLDWFVKCFNYVCYYNLRMLQLNDPNYNQDPAPIKVVNLEPTLEEKLMQNTNVKETDKPQLDDNSELTRQNLEPIVDSEPLTDRDKEAIKEYNLMDVEEIVAKTNKIESESTVTIINKSNNKSNPSKAD